MAKKGRKKNRYGKRSRSGGGGSGSLPDPDLGFSVNVIGGDESYTDILARSRQAVEDLKIEMEELTDAEAGVIRSTGEITDAHRSLFRTLTEGERMKGITEEAGKLGEALMDLGKEFLKTEEGEKMFAGLSEGVKAFGSTATSIVGGVASGFATGGPVGAAIGGLTGLVKTLGGEWLEANKRIEESNADLARAEAEHYDRMRERRREAVSGEIQRAYQEELETIEKQNEELARQRELRGVLQGRDREAFELQQSRDRSNGKDKTVLKSQRIAFDLRERQQAVDEELSGAKEKTLSLERERNRAFDRREGIKDRGLGTDRDEYKKAESELEETEKKYAAAREEEEALKKASVPRRVQNEYRAETEATDLDREARDGIAGEAERLRDELARGKKSGSLSKAAAGSLAELDSVLEDGKVGSNEVGRVKAAIDGLKNSREASDRAVIEGMKEISALSQGYTRSIEQLVTGLNNQRDEIRRIAAKLNKAADGR